MPAERFGYRQELPEIVRVLGAQARQAVYERPQRWRIRPVGRHARVVRNISGDQGFEGERLEVLFWPSVSR